MNVGKNSWISSDTIIEQPELISIGDNVQIKSGVILRPESGFIVIGNNVVINNYTVICAKGGVEIGDWTTLEPHCGIYARIHTFDSYDKPLMDIPTIGLPVTLMGDHLIGANSQIFGGVTLGKGTVVGAGTVVSESVPMAKIVTGNPAFTVTDRFRKTDWQFAIEERCSIDKTPERFWEYINNRAAFCIQHLIPSDIVLDVGCGEGYITNRLQDHCAKIVGIDYSPDAIATARKQYGIESYHMSCTHLQFQDNSFDKVIFTELIEHLTRIQGQIALTEAKRVLKPGGKLVGSTPLRTTPKSFPVTYSHIHEYSKEELQELLRDWGDVTIYNPHFVASKPE